MCRGGMIKLILPMGDQDYPECELSLTRAEWLGTYLGEDEIPGTFLTLQPDDFVRFANRIKDKLAPPKRIILGAQLNRRKLTKKDLRRLQLLGQTMTPRAINKARFDARKTLAKMLRAMGGQSGSEGEAGDA